MKPLLGYEIVCFILPYHSVKVFIVKCLISFIVSRGKNCTMDDVFKKPHTPVKKKLNFLESDIDFADMSLDENIFSDSDDFSFDSGNQFFSQSLSQLSQVVSQPGKFTYLTLMERAEDSLLDDVTIPKHSNNSCAVFFDSLHQLNSADKYLLMIQTIDQSYMYFSQPNKECIDFLQYCFHFYPKLIQLKHKESYSNCLSLYKRFLLHLFEDVFLNSNWSRQDVARIFYNQNKGSKYDFLFNLIRFIIKLIGKHEKHGTEDLFYEDATVALSLLEASCTYFSRDCAKFMAESKDYFLDINNYDDRNVPILIKMIWDRKPEYLCSTLKQFIHLYCRSIEKLQNSKATNRQYQSQIDLFFNLLTRLFMLLMEFYRFGIGNPRPYINVYSSKNCLALELYEQLEKLACTSWGTIAYLSTSYEPYPYLHCQFILQVLSKKFINLNQLFGAQLKDCRKLSLRSIVYIFLLGDVRSLKHFQFERIRKRKLSPETKCSLPSPVDQVKRSRRLVKLPPQQANSQAAKSVQNAEYHKYINRKTAYGGNSLHIACRKNDTEAVKNLFELVNVNQPDYNGYTPLMDAVRFENVDCVRTLIRQSNESRMQLNFENISLKEGFTALHFAMDLQNRDLIQLLLENGGMHLLNIQSAHEESPEDLLDEESDIRQFIQSFEFSQSNEENCLPNLDSEDAVNNYSMLVGDLIEAYISMVKLAEFQLSDEFEDKNASSEELKQNLSSQLSFQYCKLFERQPTTDDVDHLMDDLLIVTQLEHFTKRFYQLLQDRGYSSNSNILRDYFEQNLLRNLFPIINNALFN